MKPESVADQDPTLESGPAHNRATGSEAPYDWLHLTKNEQVLWSGRRSRLPFLPTGLFAGIVFLGIIAVFATGGPMAFLPIPNIDITQLNILGGVTVTTSLLSTLVLVILALLVFLVEVTTYLNWRFTYYVITSQELYFRTGIISESIVQIRLENIQNTGYSRSILERLLGYGDISIETSGTDTTELVIKDIPNPRHVNGILTNQRGRIANNHGDGNQAVRME